LSLNSLRVLAFEHIGRTHLFIDKEDPLHDRQIEQIKATKLAVEINLHDRVTGWGAHTIINQLKAFRDVASNLKPHDYLAKLDSDILFLNPYVFKKALKANADLVGSRGGSDLFSYTQGGCYFLRASAILGIGVPTNAEIGDSIRRTIARFHARTDKYEYYQEPCPEDAAIYNLFTTRGYSARFIRFYISPSQSAKAHLFTEDYYQLRKRLKRLWRYCLTLQVVNICRDLYYYRGRFSVMHFSDCKNQMIECAKRLGL
jgi:glycosyltransferase involved in cell wall biosynthesis